MKSFRFLNWTCSILYHAATVLLAMSSLFAPTTAHANDAGPKTIRALLIAGGCCHDYAKQQEALCKGIQSRANVQVDVYWTDNSTTEPILPLYAGLNWSEGYDVIIHDECAADIKDPALVNRIIQTHKKIPAVHLHCAMHSFRTGNDAWFRHLGLQSSGHGPQEPIDIQFVKEKHPIVETLSDWTTVKEELYNNVKILDAIPIAMGKQRVGKGDKARDEEAVVAWVNESQGARSFSTTIGHNTETILDDRYLELVTRGLLWACGKLSKEYLVPYSGENKVTFIDKTKFIKPTHVANAPANATLAKVTASSSQASQDSHLSIDGNVNTRWCADGGNFPEWLQLEFEKSHEIEQIQIVWEFNDRPYRYRVEGSNNGKDWTVLLDQSKEARANVKLSPSASNTPVKFVRITGVGATPGSWCSIREVKLVGKTLGTLWPADTKAEKDRFVPLQGESYQKSGNSVPRIEKLSPAEEAAILKDVTVADGFEASVFASPPAVNYPVFVAASVDGTLYVSSDGNGSLGRDPMRGRVIRLRDLDGDGRADETKVFCEIDAPRGLLWDHDRLFVMHPPHLSAFMDRDGDGVAEEQKILVKNLAFGYDKRPADHTTNGISLGVDGWLYIAGGDFGFMDAEGTDGRKLTHRGGGVLRVRPDGTGLEIYSTGTRNILEVAISPQMDMFTRDNTNDGGGWDVRLHHFTGMDDHGYPRLYKNFPDECVKPLADYGGGSGCGAVYIDEPGFGKWGNAPFTADWGTGSIYRHSVAAKGSTFEEVEKPESFIKMTRPTDADVDGNSRVYCASWKGATFNWAGPNVGYIVCVRPKGFQPKPMIEFAKASDSTLVETMKSDSYRRRMEAQRELMRRGNPAYRQLLEDATAGRSELRNLLDQLQTDATETQLVEAIGNSDPVVAHVAIRCAAKRGIYEACFRAIDEQKINAKPLLRALAMMHRSEVVDGLLNRIAKAVTSEMRREQIIALCRLHFVDGPWNGDSWGTRPDTRGPYYQPEPWSESTRIADFLRQHLANADADEASFLVEAMEKNRIESDDSLGRILQLAKSNDQLLGTAIMHIAKAKETPADAMDFLMRAIDMENGNSEMLGSAVVALSRMDSEKSSIAMFTGLSKLKSRKKSKELNGAKTAFLKTSKMDAHVASIAQTANAASQEIGFWADAALLSIATRSDGSPETVLSASKAIESAWDIPDRRIRLMQAAMESENHFLDRKILEAMKDKDDSIAKVAQTVSKQLKIKPRIEDSTPKVSSLTSEEVHAQAISMKGDVNLGKEVFAKANCAACHTVRQDEVQKGPYLGTIAKTYKRPELVTAILEPSKTIAQGFATNLIQTESGEVYTGFVTNELADRVTIRDQKGHETTIMKKDIEERKTSQLSVMPAGVINDYSVLELASLIDYIESLSQP